MKCASENCPVLGYANMSPSVQREKRRAKAKELRDRNFAEADIAAMFGVDRSTISRDLQEFVQLAQTEHRTSKRGRKGEGRPKGSRKPAPRTNKVQDAVDQLVREGKAVPRKQLAAEFGVGENSVQRAHIKARGKLEAEAHITPDMLSISAQQKLEAAIRQNKRKLDIEFAEQVRVAALQAMEEMLVHHKEKYARAERILKSRKGIMDKATYRKILSCLHPDRLHAMGVKDTAMIRRYEDAFGRFTELEDLLMDEKQNPSAFPPMPKSAAEWMEAKANRAKRGNGSFAGHAP